MREKSVARTANREAEVFAVYNDDDDTVVGYRVSGKKPEFFNYGTEPASHHVSTWWEAMDWAAFWNAAYWRCYRDRRRRRGGGGYYSRTASGKAMCYPYRKRG